MDMDASFLKFPNTFATDFGVRIDMGSENLCNS
jgi:hypothetical protein